MVSVWSLVLLVATQIGFQLISCAEEDDDDVQSPISISKSWGISDVSTCVGKLFQYKIPPEKDAFKGSISYFEVNGEGGSIIPQWMIYDRRRSMLEGVPTMDDIGDTRIGVKAYDVNGNFVTDIFVVDVYPLEERNIDDKRKCGNGEEITVMKIIVDKDVDNISSSQRIIAIHELSHYLNIPANTMLLLPQTSMVGPSKSEIDDVSNEDANSTVITWQIGCNGGIWKEEMRVVQLIKKSSNVLAEVLRLPVVRSSTSSNLNPFRIRRQTSETSTGNDDLDEQDIVDDDDEVGSDGDDGTDVENEHIGPIGAILRNNSETFVSGNAEKSEIFSGPSNNFRKLGQFSDTNDDETDTEPPEESIFDRNNETIVRLNLCNDMDDCLNNSCNLMSSCNVTSTGATQGSSTITTEQAIQNPPRNPPRVTKKLDGYTIEAGKYYRIPIPEDIFEDEDGNTRNLTLKLEKLNTCLDSWIELDVKEQTLLMIPSEEAISTHTFPLIATNSANLQTNNTLMVTVRYPKRSRLINFEISLHMQFKADQNLTANLQYELLQLLARLYGDSNIDNMQVRHVTCNPFVFTWTNNTLLLDRCDNGTIFKLLNVLTDEEGSMNVNKNVHHVIGSLLTVEKVTWTATGQCQGVVPPAHPPQPQTQNFSPIARNHIDNLTARVGELLVFRIPEDTFYDPDVASSEDLHMTLKTYDLTSLPPENWLQFDEKNREIYGLPPRGSEGITKYNLECQDTINQGIGGVAYLTIEVIVEPAANKPYNVEFKMTLNSSFDKFVRIPAVRRTFVEKLAALFGDKNTSSIVIFGHVEGSLTVFWYNKTLPIDKCPEGEIEALRKVLLADDKELNEHVVKFMAPEFSAISAVVSPIGLCEGSLTELHTTEMNAPSQEIYATIFNANVSHYIRLYFFHIILPIVIIIVMMMFAVVIACILYRRQRRAKWALGNDDERRSFRNRGIPVIFQNEMEERLETSNKTPIIMKVERPPQPPPEYQKTPPMATTALLSDFDDTNYQNESGTAIYSSRSIERNGRNNGTPTCRKPPPYLPP